MSSFSFTLLHTSSAWQLLNCWGHLSLLPSSSSCCWIMWQPPTLPLIPGCLSWCWLLCWKAAPNPSLNHISNKSPTRWSSPTSARNINRSAERGLDLVVVYNFYTWKWFLLARNAIYPIHTQCNSIHLLDLVLLWKGKRLLFKWKP